MQKKGKKRVGWPEKIVQKIVNNAGGPNEGGS